MCRQVGLENFADLHSWLIENSTTPWLTGGRLPLKSSTLRFMGVSGIRIINSIQRRRRLREAREAKLRSSVEL